MNFRRKMRRNPMIHDIIDLLKQIVAILEGTDEQEDDGE